MPCDMFGMINRVTDREIGGDNEVKITYLIVVLSLADLSLTVLGTLQGGPKATEQAEENTIFSLLRSYVALANGSSPAIYTSRNHEIVFRSHTWRTATNSAAHPVGLLRPNMQTLDIGCGLGTIPADFAAFVLLR